MRFEDCPRLVAISCLFTIYDQVPSKYERTVTDSGITTNPEKAHSVTVKLTVHWEPRTKAVIIYWLSTKMGRNMSVMGKRWGTQTQNWLGKAWCRQ